MLYYNISNSIYRYDIYIVTHRNGKIVGSVQVSGALNNDWADDKDSRLVEFEMLSAACSGGAVIRPVQRIIGLLPRE